jgi:class 3 adenylate cyclase
MGLYGLAAAGTVLFLRPLWAFSATAALLATFLVTAFVLFDGGTIIDLPFTTASISFCFLGASVHSLASEKAQRKELDLVFGRFVSKAVAARVLDAMDHGSLALGGQELEVTVMFADVRGFTGICENTPPRELVHTLNRYLSVVISAVLESDGVVNKFAGDSIMAVWNTPAASDAHALRAIKAALASQEGIRRLRAEDASLQHLEFGIGVNTGTALAGNMGSEARMEFSVIGDAVNVASRLTGATPGGEVWAGERTYELVRDYVEALPLGNLSVKGKSRGVAAYQIVRVDSRPRPIK